MTLIAEHRTLWLIGEPRDVYVARVFARQVLAAHEAGGSADDAVLVVSELVTNALLHGDAPIALTIDVEPDAVRISVSDTGVADPFRRHPADEDEGGRGLPIVESLSTEWRVERARGVKSTVARVPLRRARLGFDALVPRQRME